MIWFCLIVLVLVMSDADHAKPVLPAVCAVCMVALVYLHFWITGAIP